MPVPGLDARKCKRRNRRAARLGLNAVPVRFLAKAPDPIDTTDPETQEKLRVVTARGSLPRTNADALERINRMRGDDADPLESSDIWLVYCEAGNSNFIKKYYMHLADSTLRNIARRASKSIAFMNSHRTGGLSTPAELPYGRTFAGRFEQATTGDGRTFSRTLLGIYMLRGEYPNGKDGPSTDSLYKGIAAGTIFDVSLGLMGGDEVCDVCGERLDEADDKGRALCVHVPGTHYKMTDEEIDGQIARGVPDGVCSITLEDATAGEVSPVFDGAVPGAGFRKALSAARSYQLSATDLDEARRSFATLVGRRDFRPEPGAVAGIAPAPGPTPLPLHDHDSPHQPRGRAMSRSAASHPPKTVSVAALRQLLGQAGIELEDDEEGDGGGGGTIVPATASPQSTANATATPSPSPSPSTTPRQASSDMEERLRAVEEQNHRLEQTLATEREERRRDNQAQRRATVLAEAANWADGLIRASAAIPAERDELIALHAQAAMDDHEQPAQVNYRESDGTPKKGTRVQALHALWAKRGSHDFSREHVAPRDAMGAGTGVGAGETSTAPAASSAALGTAPLHDLSPLPHQAKADPVLDSMLRGNEDYLSRRNGHTPADARPR